MLFFGKEEFVEEPLKDILDSFQVTKTHPLSQYVVFLFTQHSFTRLYLPLVSCESEVKVISTWLKPQQRSLSYPIEL